MRSIIIFLSGIFLFTFSSGQLDLPYQKPPPEILELVDVPMPPGVLIDSKAENMVFLYRDSYVTIAELSEEELRLAGLRINPKTNSGSRVSYYRNLKLKRIGSEEVLQIKDLPENPRIANLSWSPDESMLAFTNTSDEGVELWVLFLESVELKKLTGPELNANLGRPFTWFRDNSALLVEFLPDDREKLINRGTSVPGGPIISVSEGEKAQNRTYQDLLKNPDDEFNFEQLTRSELFKLGLDGTKESWLKPDMYRGTSFSPDGNYILITTIKRPFSYLVPYNRFPVEGIIYDKDGKMVKQVLDLPLAEVIPKGFDAATSGRRSMSWRKDKAATLYWVEALDEGNPETEVDFRDEIFELPAPFESEPVSLFKTRNRYGGITWGNEEVAVVYDQWWSERNSKTYLFNPSVPGQEGVILFDRNYQDAYSDPGSFVTRKNNFNIHVLDIRKNNLFLMGDGFSEKGQFPFIDRLDINTLKTRRLYESSYRDKLEVFSGAVDMSEGKILVSIQSQTEYPNFYFRNIYKKDALTQLTSFKNPFESLEGVHKELLKYKRADGLELDALLYLPEGYDMNTKEKLPMIMWAYPREYKDRNSASQNTSNPNRFISPSYGSPVYWLKRGYVVLDNAAFPIVGEGEMEPNDTYIEQLVSNAKAAIDFVDSLGYIDRSRVAVGGHSYGAFMVANLLSHSDLFAAGIARSGAYNRTLTPFGFQSEERSYWDSPETYYTMSPFMHADKMKTPLLLIHGEADNNSGTYPLQSERYFNALKGLGAPARLVILPKESHGYRAKESILHLLWEQDQWLEKYVKNR